MRSPTAPSPSPERPIGPSRRRFLRTCAVGAAGLAAPRMLRARAPSENRPNIVLILADDMGYSDLGCFGSEIRTPHIDSLAARGVRFTQFYNCAVCCPTRSSLLTGLFPHQAGVGWMVLNGSDSRPPGPYQGFLNDRCVTLAEVLRSAGYRTYMSGKWHVGENRPHWPVDRGFDRSFSLISGAANYFDITKDYLPGTIRQMALDGEPYHPPKHGFYMTDAFTEHAVDFLGQASRLPDPFFLYLAYTAPHFPLHAPADAIARCRGRFREGWDVLRARRFERQKRLGIVAGDAVLSPRYPSVPSWDSIADPELEQRRMEVYAAQVERMDSGVGRVLAQLRAIGAEDNTLVVFLSDNGAEGLAELARFRAPELNRPPYLGGVESFDSYGSGWANVSDTPLRKFKACLEEGGISTGLIAAGAGVGGAPGSICRTAGHIIDLMPTFADFGRAIYPDRFRGRNVLPMEGVSLRPLFEGGSIRREQPFAWEWEGQRAITDGKWKLLGGEDAPWALYDLEQDRAETRDLAASAPGRVRDMAVQYDRWALRCGVRPWKETGHTLTNVPGVG